MIVQEIQENTFLKHFEWKEHVLIINIFSIVEGKFLIYALICNDFLRFITLIYAINFLFSSAIVMYWKYMPFNF